MTLKLSITSASGRYEPFEIEVEDSNVIGGLYAIHPYYIEGGKSTRGWTASHIRSGACIGQLKTEVIAKRLAKKLLPYTNDTDDMTKVFTDKQAAMDIVILDRRRAAGGGW